MDEFLNKLEKRLLPIAEKLNNQPYLAALRDGFIAIMPLMLIGAFALMINNVFLNYGEGSLFQTLFGFEAIPNDSLPPFVQWLQEICVIAANATLSIAALVVTFTISYSFTERKGYKPLEAGVIAVAALFASFVIVDGTYDVNFFSAANIITGIVLALMTGEIYCYLLKKDIRVKMPEGVPPAVESSFSALIPAATIVVFTAILHTAVLGLSDWMFSQGWLDIQINSLSEFIQLFIGVPLKAVGGGVVGMYIYTGLVDLLWFFGIHGPNTLAFIDQGIFTPAAIENANLITQGFLSPFEILDPVRGASATVFTKSLVDSYVFMGGVGSTIGLIIAILISSKVQAHRQIAKLSLGPAFFNINEPLLFGLPIVFNPVLFIPYIIVSPLLLTFVLVMMKILPFLPIYSIPIPWTSPPIVGAFLAYGGNLWSALLALLCVVISTLIYLPFVLVMNRMALDEEKSEASLK